MKICPVCHQTYSDDSLNFCLNDGTTLSFAESSESNQPTVYIEQTSPKNEQYGKPNTFPQNNWNPNALNNVPSQQPAPKKSRAWLWVVGIVGGVMLLAIIGFVGLIGLAVSLGNTNVNNRPTNSTSTTNSQNGSSVLKDDFSGWQRGASDLGTTDYQNGEFIAASKLPTYYYVLMTRNANFTTTNSTTRVSVRNPDNKSSSFGFGLVVKINPVNSTRYGFLINTVQQSYRIVLHSNNKENTIVNWTKSAPIRSGTQLNELKVKDENGTMTFYINDQQITTVKDSTGTSSGVAGIYTSGAVPIAFSGLEVAK